MRKIKKLTPELIKQIISEEKIKVDNFLQKKRLEERNNLLKKLRLLKKISNKQKVSLSENKKLDNMKSKLIKSIKKRV